MKLAARRTSIIIATAATAGVSTVFAGAAPAMAAGESCGTTGTLVSPGVCEARYTSGTSTFTPTPQMTKLEVLLVGAGGAGYDPGATSTGYAAAGGGGEVRVVDFSGSTAPIQLTVASAGAPGSAVSGTRTEPVRNGADAVAPVGGGTATGGASGNGNAGAIGYGGSGGAGGGSGAATTTENGGAGVSVQSLVAAGSLFAGDTECFGGGGATGFAAGTPTLGTPGCGGGGPDATATGLIAAVANSGGGGGSVNTTQSAALRAGASGIVIVRWTSTVTLSFDARGHGTAPATQTLAYGTAGARPADPKAEGFQFEGWFTDPSLTTPADFTAALTGSATYYAKWVPVLAETGLRLDPVQLIAPLGALVVGAALVLVGRRRRGSE